MKKYAVMLLFSCVTLSLFAFDFRKTDWGMSMNSVIASESGLDYAIDNSSKDPHRTAVRFDIVVNGHNGWLMYQFYDDHLIFANYQFPDGSDFLVFNDISKSINDKYGKPVSSSSRGSMWQTDRSVIICEFQKASDPSSRGNNCLVYSFDRTYFTKMKQQQKTENESNF